MSRITPQLYLGDINDAQNYYFLRSNNIHHIVNCTDDIPNFFQNNFHYTKLWLIDHPQQPLHQVLDSTADLIISLLRTGHNVFVHCYAGVSRSASIVIYTLMKLHSWNYEKAFQFVRDSRSQVNPNSGFVQQLTRRNNPVWREGVPALARSQPKNEVEMDDFSSVQQLAFGTSNQTNLYARIF